MCIAPIPHVRLALSGLLVLFAGCANPSSQSSLNSLSVKVTPATVSVGGAVTLQATAVLSNGTTQDVTSATQWTLSNPSLATLGSGVLTSKAAGILTVQAAYIVVTSAGQSSWTAGSVPQTLTSSAQVTITAAGTTAPTPSITWSAPGAIQYGTALGAASLDATANVPGSFAYTPAAGTVLKAGTQTLTATFTPSDTSTYSSATATVRLTVNQSAPAITWAPPSAVQQGTAISAMQLNATANVPGAFSYSPPAGTVVALGTQPLTATFTPADNIDYMPATAHNSLTVDASDTGKSTPILTWPTPAAIQYGLALNSVQLDATASVPGGFAYAPPAGTVLKAGSQTLTAAFTPTNTTTYSSAAATVQLTVNQATPAISWAALAAITKGTALGSAQLDATANVPGGFAYNRAAGNIPAAGTLQLTATFTPTDTADYAVSTVHNSLVVNSASNPAPTPAPPTPAPPTDPPLTGCGGPTVNVNSGMSQNTLSSTISSAASCAMVVFAAGTYTITSQLKVPCGVTLSGPTVAWPGPYTAVLNTNSLGGTPAIAMQSGCSTSITGAVQYLEINAKQPSPDGGAAIYLPVGGGPAVIIQNNYLHGNWANASGSGSQGDTLIWIDGDSSTTSTPGTWNNVTIQWNRLGGSNSGTPDCNSLNSLFDYQGGNYNSAGGYCAGIGIHSNFSNLSVNNNIIGPGEQGMKFFEPPCSTGCGQGAGGDQFWQSGTNNICYNDFTGQHRIVIEAQQTPNTTIEFCYNDQHDQNNPGQGSWVFSLPQYDGSIGTATNEFSNSDYNVWIGNVAPTSTATDAGGYIPGTVEFWGNGHSNYNLTQGYFANAQSYHWGNAPWAIENNTVQIPNGPYYSGQYIYNGGANQPTLSGNVTSATVSPLTSVAPTISPASGTFTGSEVVTFTNPGTNRDTNTGIWVTTDGSTPTPGSGTAVYYSSGRTLTVTSTTTVKAVGMWGARNQPTSYPSGYGYVPSAVVTASYTAVAASLVKQPVANVRSAVGTNTVAEAQAVAAAPAITAGAGAAAAVLASVAIVPAQAEVTIGSTTQLKAIATFSDGSTKDVTTDFAWTSSDTRTITATSSGLLSGLATGKATITGTYEGSQASVPAVSSIGQVDWSGPIVISEAGTYSGNWQSTDSKTPAVTVATAAPVVIENSHISSVAGLIKTTVAGADLTVRNSVGLAVNAGVKGQANGVFLEASSPARLDVENNYIENAGGGVVVHGYSGNRDGQQTVVIRANRARNLNGLLSDGNGGYLPPVGSNRSVSSFIELDKVQAVPGIDVGWNEVINYPGHSLVADNIAVKSSSGTPNQPLEIHDTYIQGAYPYTAAQADYQGGGIKTEGSPEDSAQQAPAFNSIHDNQVVGTVNHGIEFTAGHDNIAAHNRVISSGMLANGTRLAAQHVGMANGDVNSAMQDNLIGWACWTSSCSQSGYRQDQSFPGSPGDYSTNSVLPPQPITPAMENNEYQIWLNKTASAGITVGPVF